MNAGLKYFEARRPQLGRLRNVGFRRRGTRKRTDRLRPISSQSAMHPQHLLLKGVPTFARSLSFIQARSMAAKRVRAGRLAICLRMPKCGERLLQIPGAFCFLTMASPLTLRGMTAYLISW